MLVVVVDTSGSMREHGKAMLARNLVACVRNQDRFGTQTSQIGIPTIVRWGATAEIVDTAPERELPWFDVGGQASIAPLLDLLSALLPRDDELKVLIISDGHLPRAALSAFRAWRRQRPAVSVRALAIGPDAVRATLKKIADRGGVFPAAEATGALATWASRPTPALPTRVEEVRQIVTRSSG